MTDRTVTPAPPVHSGQAALPKPQGDDVPARVTGATGNLSNVARPVTLAGTISNIGSDGTATVSTAQGDVSVVLKPQSGLTDGQLVNIDVAAGRPPRQAIIRPGDAAPTTATPPVTEDEPAIPLSSPPPSSTPSPPGPLSRGDLPVAVLTDSATADITAHLQEPIAAPPAQSPLRPGDNVRLLALPPEAVLPLTIDAVSPATATLPTPTLAPAIENLLTAPILPSPLTIPSSPVIPAQAGIRQAGSISAPSSLPNNIVEVSIEKIAPTNVTVNTVKSATPLSLALQTILPVGKAPPALDIHIVSIAPPAPLLQEKTTPVGAPLTPLKISTATPPTTTPTKSIAPPTPTTLTAQVVARTPQNLPILSTILPGQKFPTLFALQFSAANLPVGTTITFTPHADAAEPAIPLATADDIAAPTPQNLLSGATWPVLDAVKAALTTINPAAANSFTNLLPNTNTPAQIPVAALLFIAAMRSGDIESWLGDKTINNLRQAGRADLLGKLKLDLDSIGKLDSPKAAPESWRSIPLPFNHGGELQKMALYYRHDREPSKDDQRPEKTRATRFIFDMSLTRLGAVQLDGLHRPGETEGKLDLIVRTKVPLSPTMQQAMRRTYVAALESNQQSGEISFQTRAEQWVKVR